jgi:putative transposase
MSNRRQVIDDELYAHFVTFSVYRRRRLLTLDQPKRILFGVLKQELRQQSAKCVVFVIMPEHVHAIIWFPEMGRLSQFMHGWKWSSARWYAWRKSVGVPIEWVE